jgi:hypothetical protein
LSDDGSEMQFCQNLKALTLLFFIGALGCSHSPAQRSVVEAEPVWSVALSQGPFHNDTSSDFAATRRAVIVGSRVVVLIDLGPTAYVAGRPKSNHRLLSLDLASGAVLNQQDLSDFRAPDLYATDDDHVIIGEFSLRRLNPDLTPTLEQYTDTGHGRTIQISPDGSTLAHETAPGTELLDSHTLRPTGTRLSEVRSYSGESKIGFDRQCSLDRTVPKRPDLRHFDGRGRPTPCLSRAVLRTTGILGRQKNTYNRVRNSQNPRHLWPNPGGSEPAHKRW